MRTYTVTGMSCAACAARVEKAVRAVPGVTSCAVSLLTNSMGVQGDAAPEDIIRAVENAGYGARPADAATSAASSGSANTATPLTDTETPRLRRRLVWSLLLLLPLLYMSMGHMLWDWPLPAFFNDNHTAMGLAQLLLTAAVMVINQKFFVRGARSLVHGAPNMDTLVALGAAASFGWSTWALFAMTRAQADGDKAAILTYMKDFYFETAAMILTLITVGKMLEARSKGKTTDALKSLMRLAPQTAVVLRGGSEVEIPVSNVRVGDDFVVRPGGHVPVDGEVLEGESAVNEAALTGESMPVDKGPGDRVAAATANVSGFLRCRATRVGEDTTLAQIIRMVSDAAATKAPISQLADRVSGIFVPAVIAIAILTTAGWLLAGESAGFALARGIAVLVISCPCALGLATPVAIMVGSGVAARHGILFKTAAALEQTGRTRIVTLDKTGTLTNGAPVVTDILPADGVPSDDVLACALALESKSEHPLARAVMTAGEERNLSPAPVEDFRAVPGNGLSAVAAGRQLAGGNRTFISGQAPVPPLLATKAEALAAEGKTPLYFSRDGTVLGCIAVADTLKPDSPEAVRQLQGMGIRVVMLTGDNERTARAVGAQVGVDALVAGVLPDGKEQVVRELREKGATAMVGDGINDAPALTRADTGIAIGAGADVALDAAGVVLVNNRLADVPAAIRLSRATLSNIRQNLFWAFFYNVLGIPLAAGVLQPLLGWTLNPVFGAAAMSLSSFCVVSNALRLNLFNPHDARRDRKEAAVPLSSAMDAAGREARPALCATLRIAGMMCPHCEARVKTALEAVEGVLSAAPSHERGEAVVELADDVPEDAFRRAVEDAGYQWQGVR
ncbi:MAG: heavy metal translocating P-type ATPase [Lachnospiraceae bacterium]|nr:heavy metal translocating P-type ATPase [Lachnospiraceae bacterium]